MERTKKYLEINNCCFLIFGEILFLTLKKKIKAVDYKILFLEIKVNMDLMVPVLEKVLSVCSDSNNNKLKKLFEY